MSIRQQQLPALCRYSSDSCSCCLNNNDNETICETLGTYHTYNSPPQLGYFVPLRYSCQNQQIRRKSRSKTQCA